MNKIIRVALIMSIALICEGSAPMVFNPRLWGITAVEEIKFVQIITLGEDCYIDVIMKDRPYRSPAQTFPAVSKSYLPVTIIDFKRKNGFNGITAAFSDQKSTSAIGYENNAAHMESIIRFDYTVVRNSYAGFYIRLYEREGLPQFYSFFDATGYDYLSFYSRGGKSSSGIVLRLADQKWEKKGDAVTLGSLEEFTKGPYRQHDWNRVVVPLPHNRNINLQQCASLVFLASLPARESLLIKDLRFGVDAAHGPRTPVHDTRCCRKAVWAWETETYAADLNRWETLLQLLHKDGFTDIFLQLVYSQGNSIVTDAFSKLITVCSKYAIKVHALDGNPEMAREEHHQEVLSIIRAVAGYNGRVSPEKRFEGIQLDIEPYLLRIDNPMERDKVLRQYIELLRQCSTVTDSFSLEFGVAVPFWFDTKWYRGKSITRYVTDLVDYLALMNYRTFAFGENGALVHAIDEMEYAEVHHRKVFIGLETHKVERETYAIFTDSGKGPSEIAINQYGADSAVISLYKKGKRHGRNQGYSLFLEKTVVSDPGNVSFYGKTFNELEYLSRQLHEEYDVFESFYGIAYHSLESYLLLKGLP